MLAQTKTNRIKKLRGRLALRAAEREGFNFALFICAPIEKKFNKARFLLSNCLCKPTYIMPIVRFQRHFEEKWSISLLFACLVAIASVNICLKFNHFVKLHFMNFKFSFKNT